MNLQKSAAQFANDEGGLRENGGFYVSNSVGEAAYEQRLNFAR